MRNIHQPTTVDNRSFSDSNARTKILTVLEYAVLAPSTHNTQPWKFEISDSRCKVFIDNSRQLPAADPQKRNMYISLGAMLKNIELAATAFGVFKGLKISDKTGTQVAEVIFKNLGKKGSQEAVSPSPYLDAIRTRTNYRGPFSPVKISEKDKNQFITGNSTTKVFLVENRKTIEKLGSLTAEGLKIAYSRSEFRKEISKWIKSNTSTQKKGIPGYSLRMPLFTSHVIPRLIRYKDIGPKLAKLNYQSFVSASAVAILASEQDDEVAWINAGQTAQEIFLNMELVGLACSIFVAAIETKGLRPKINEITDINPKLYPQFLFCIGKPGLPKVYSPRESVKSKTIS